MEINYILWIVTFYVMINDVICIYNSRNICTLCFSVHYTVDCTYWQYVWKPLIVCPTLI